MITETKALVLRQVKTIHGRRVIGLFTEDHGKISAGVTVSERGRGRGQAAMNPFTYGTYELYISRGYYHLNKATSLRTFYTIGEDVDKYLAASYGLELCDKLLEEDMPAQEVFSLTVDFLTAMEERRSHFETLLLAYQVKLVAALGMKPILDRCARCGRPMIAHEGDPEIFSVQEGGLLCEECRGKEEKPDVDGPSEGSRQALRYEVDFDILNVLNHFLTSPLASLQKLALRKDMTTRIQTIIDRFIVYHFDPGDLKSGAVRIEGTEVASWKSH